MVLERLDILDSLALTAQAGTLTPTQQKEANSIAHKLAGSLGMFGYHEGTRVARQLEQQLDTPTPDPATLTDLTQRLRASLETLDPEPESDLDS